MLFGRLGYRCLGRRPRRRRRSRGGGPVRAGRAGFRNGSLRHLHRLDRGRDWRGRGHRGRGRRAFVFGRIEQESVLAYQATSGPVEFHHQVKEGLVHRLRRTEDYDILTLAALFDAEFDRQQRTAVFDAGFSECLCRWQPYAKIVCFAFFQSEQFDLRLQGFPQAGKHSQLTQPRGGG